MADNKVGNYEQFVIVAEAEWKVDYGTQFLMTRRRYLNSAVKPWPQVQPTRCTWSWSTIPDRTSNPNESYSKKETIRHIFSRLSNSLTRELNLRHNVFTVRILNDRSMFADFTLENTVVGGRWASASDGKLRVAGQLFHVNKQLLSMHSDHFDRMFNGPYVETNQEEVELKHEQADPAMFHDFLLVMCVPEALPNPKNVAALSVLANIYQTANVVDKCHNHLEMCREMPVEERYMLAGELGRRQLQISIASDASLEETRDMLANVSNKAFALK